MRRLVTAGLLAAVAVLAWATPALAQTVYFVQTAADGPPTACAPIDGAPIPAARCDTLRSALAAANASSSPDQADTIFLQAAGIHALTEPSELVVTDNVTIAGRGPRTTTIQGNGSARVFSVASGATAGILRLTVAGGRAVPGAGGNILNAGFLLLLKVRVTGGVASTGGGIANLDGLIVDNSLIDGNQAASNGGGIFNDGSGGGAATAVSNSTVAFNSITGSGTGGGIATSGSSSNTISLTHVTLARNTIQGTGAGAGVSTGATGETVAFSGSLVANNSVQGSPANCSGPGAFVELQPASIDTGATCSIAFANQGTQVNDALTNEGGETDVLRIPASSPAKGIATQCRPTDQRDAPRPATGCDAGAFQEGAVAPPFDSGPVGEPGPVQPPPPPPPPTPTPTPTPTPQPPVFNQTVGVQPVGGTVEVCPPRQRCRRLAAGETIPMGSTVDTRKGEVLLTSLPSRGGQPQQAKFRDGIFKVTQSRSITLLTLTEELDCGRRGRAGAAQKKPKSRRLWGDGKGKFRTKGRYSAATVRGTKWVVIDTCTTTTTRVTQGSVTVQVRGKTVIVRKGKRYVARRP